MPKGVGYKKSGNSSHNSSSSGPTLKVIPVAPNGASQSGSMGGGSKTGNETMKKKPSSKIGSVRSG